VRGRPRTKRVRKLGFARIARDHRGATLDGFRRGSAAQVRHDGGICGFFAARKMAWTSERPPLRREFVLAPSQWLDACS